MSRFHTLTVAEVRRETPDAVSVTLDVPEALRETFAFLPGQYLTLRGIIDGEDIRRPYSICAGLDDAALRVGIKKVPGGAFSTYANENLRAGDTLEVMPPQGRFVARPDPSARRHVLLVAAGSGITPVLSIARSLLSREARTRVTLLYGNRTHRSVMFAEEIEGLKNRHLGRFAVLHVLSREASDVPLLSGRLDGAKLAAIARGVVDMRDVTDAYLCGPQAMVAELSAALVNLGVPPSRIHSELFTPAAPRRAAPSVAPAGAAEAEVLATIDVTVDGRSRRFAWRRGDDNLIDAAQREGIDLPYSCKGGMCSTCRCHLSGGEGTMALNYALEPWELQAGFVLACQLRPLSAQLVLDFDRT